MDNVKPRSVGFELSAPLPCAIGGIVIHHKNFCLWNLAVDLLYQARQIFDLIIRSQCDQA